MAPPHAVPIPRILEGNISVSQHFCLTKLVRECTWFASIQKVNLSTEVAQAGKLLGAGRT